MTGTVHTLVAELLDAGLRRHKPTVQESAAMHSSCIDHTGPFFDTGYGRVNIGEASLKAHRLAFAEAHGLDHEDLGTFHVLHDCDRKVCRNPAHLRLATNAENVEDKNARGRNARLRGTANGMAVLSDEDVAAIRRQYVPGCRFSGGAALAKKYDVAKSTISYIVNNKRRRYA